MFTLKKLLFTSFLFFYLNSFSQFQKIELDFINKIHDTIIEFQFENPYILNGCGVAIADFNNDQKEDIFLTSVNADYSLLKNNGNFEFEEKINVSNIKKLNDEKYPQGILVLDINNDNLLDIYISYFNINLQGAKNELWVNKGNWKFKEEANKYGISDNGNSIETISFDIDNDNDLDLLVLNNISNEDVILNKTSNLKTSQLYKNENGYYKKSKSNFNVSSLSLSGSIADLDNDYRQDLFISNDFGQADFLFYFDKTDYKNQIKHSFNKMSLYSMGSDVADINNDLLQDIVVVDMNSEDYYRNRTTMSMSEKYFKDLVKKGQHYQYMFNALHLNQGNRKFSEIGQLAGISQTDWSWSPLIADFDNDGFQDIFITNGILNDLNLKDDSNLIYVKEYPSNPVKNYFFKNINGLQFENETDNFGFTDPTFSSGSAYGDLDNDGDLDIVVNNTNQHSFIYKNVEKKNNWLQIKLQKEFNNTLNLGAKVFLYADSLTMMREISSTRGFISSSSTTVHFGLNQRTKIDSIIVTWPDSSFLQVYNITSNQILSLKKGNIKMFPNEKKSPFLKKLKAMNSKNIKKIFIMI